MISRRIMQPVMIVAAISLPMLQFAEESQPVVLQRLVEHRPLRRL